MLRLRKFRPKFTHVLLAVLAVGVWVLAIEHYPAFTDVAGATTPKNSVSSFGAVDLHRVNVKDDNGTTRFVISNTNNFPRAKLRGKMHKRSISNAAGIVFYNPRGEETGGIATSMIHGHRQAAMIFDYDYQPTDGVAMGTHESLNGKQWGAGFSISDRRPYKPGPVGSSQGIQRISLADNNHDAELVIYDEKGRPRIRIGVAKDGKPHIQMLNAKGRAVYNASIANHGHGK